MMDDYSGFGGNTPDGDDLIEIDLNFESMRRFQAEFSPNLSKDGLFIDTGEPLSPGSVVRFRVILPEEFIFLEGTAVVEWVRSAEAVSDGAPGMALRFVTLSPQNQELVEQLVQDHVEAGGASFDFDVRPGPMDFPTDALEGAPAPASETLDEGYRLTVRRSGPNIQAEALQALSDAAARTDAEDAALQADDRVQTPEEAQGFAILSKTSVPLVEEELQKITGSEMGRADDVELASEAGAEVEEVTETEVVSDAGAVVEEAAEIEVVSDERAEAEVVGEPPSLDWSDEMEPLAQPEQQPLDLAIDGSDATKKAVIDLTDDVASDEEISLGMSFDAIMEPAEETEPALPPEPEDFPTPADFDSGPEIIEDVVSGGLGGPAFDVSLPEPDDEPDTTPVLPDEGRDEVTVHADDYDEEEPVRRRRLWPLGLAAVLVLVVAGGFLWPRINEWNQSRRAEDSQDPVIAAVDEPVELQSVPSEPQTDTESNESPELSAEPSMENQGAEEGPPEETETGESVAEPEDPPETVMEPEPEPQPTTPPPAIELAQADALTSIEVESGPRGTVITIRGNGSLEDGVISMEPLSSPPRVLIRVRGIQSHYRPYTIDSLTPEVTRVRSGLHTERRPPEMWVVVDLTGSEVALDGIDIRRDVAEVILSRP